MKLLIAGGGTGGHVIPALAIAQEWLSRGKEREDVLVGTQRGIEMKLVPQAGPPLETVRVAGLEGKGGTTLLPDFAMSAPAHSEAPPASAHHKPSAAFCPPRYPPRPPHLSPLRWPL